MKVCDIFEGLNVGREDVLSRGIAETAYEGGCYLISPGLDDIS